MNNVMIYPFDRDGLSILRHRFFPSEWKVTSLVLPHGWGNIGKDACILDEKEPTGILLSDNFDESLASVDTVLFMSTDMKINYEKNMKPKIESAIIHKKNVVCTLRISEQEQEYFEKLAEKSDCKFLYISNTNIFSENISENDLHEEKTPFMKEISTPVLMIFSTIENLSKFEIQLSLMEYLISNGYKPTLITSKPYGRLGGAYSVPDFMFSPPMSEQRKIILFNQFVHHVEQITKSDILIIGVPGGILPINKTYLSHFGITPFEITRAVIPDLAILNTHFADAPEKFYEKLSLLMEHRFSSVLGGVLIDKIFIQLHADGMPGNVERVHLTDREFSMITNSFENFKVPVRTLNRQTELYKIVLSLLEKNEIQVF